MCVAKLTGTMSALLLLVACLVLGVLVARIAHPPATLPQSLNWWVINVALSALVLHLIPTLRFDWQFWFLVASMWLVFLGSWALFATLGRALHWSRARIGALTLVCGLGNTAFIGFPMIEALRGPRGREARARRRSARMLPRARDRRNDRCRSLLGQKCERRATSTRKVLTFPPFVSLVVGIVAALLGGWPQPVDAILDRLGGDARADRAVLGRPAVPPAVSAGSGRGGAARARVGSSRWRRC